MDAITVSLKREGIDDVLLSDDADHRGSFGFCHPPGNCRQERVGVNTAYGLAP